MNSCIHYMYRDADNYKNYAEIIVEGIVELEQLQPFFHDGEFFEPGCIGFKRLQSLPLTTSDHIWHQITAIEPIEQGSSLDINANQLFERFRMASKNAWFQNQAFKELGLI